MEQQPECVAESTKPPCTVDQCTNTTGVCNSPSETSPKTECCMAKAKCCGNTVDDYCKNNKINSPCLHQLNYLLAPLFTVGNYFLCF